MTLTVSTALIGPAAGAPADASVLAACDLYASPAGNDANTGTTPAAALASPITLLNRLAPGQVGCLQDGANFTLGGGEAITATGGTVAAPKTIRPTTAGARSTITTTTGFWLQPASHDLVLEDLDIRRTVGSAGSLFQVDGDRITLDGVDLSYPSNICLDVGGDPRGGGTADPTEDFALLNSRVHECGADYGPPRGTNDSGVHGIYLQFVRDGADADSYGAVLRNNVIDHNNNRGLQLYPDARNVLVTHNVIYANGANLNFGSEPGQDLYSKDNTVTGNVIAESVMTGLAPGGFIGDTSEVLGNFPVGSALTNHVDGNCIANTAHPTELYEGYGFTHVGNTENQAPVFVNPAGGDYHQTAGSPCLGMGLEQGSPTAPGAPTVTQTTPAAGAITVTFTPPASDGGSPVTSYTASCTSTDGGGTRTASGGASPLTVAGVTAGKHYRCRVRATNAIGTGAWSAYGATVLVPGASSPSAPVVTATAAQASAARVAFNPPASDGGSVVLQYTAQCVSTDGGVAGTASGSASPIRVTGLSGGKQYRCRVLATNAVGASAYGAYGATVLLPAPTRPPVVTVTSTVPGVGAMTVTFLSNGDGGSPILQYTASCVSTDGGLGATATGTGNAVSVTGLTSGRTYQCRVRATNAVGTSAWSAYSAPDQVG